MRTSSCPKQSTRKVKPVKNTPLMEPSMQRKLNTAIKMFQGRVASDAHGKKEDFIQIARLLLQTSGQLSPPVDIECIASLLGVHSIEVIPSLPGNPPQGRLVPDLDGFTIQLLEDASKTHKRFTIAHEVGHILLYDLSQKPPRLLLSRYLQGSRSRSRMEFGFYDFAREILMPSEMLSSFGTHARTPSCSAIIQLARKFEVSEKAVCWRLFRDWHIWTGSCAVFVTNAGTTKITSNDVFRGRGFASENSGARLVDSDVCRTAISSAKQSPGRVIKRLTKVNGLPVKIEVAAMKGGKSALCLFTLVENPCKPTVQTFFLADP